MKTKWKEKWQRASQLARILAICGVIVLCLAALVGYNLYLGNTFSTRIDLQSSDDYSENELQDALSTVLKDFRHEYPRCELVDLWYTDKYNSDRRRDLAHQYDAENAVVLSSNVWVGGAGARTAAGDALDADTFYSDYRWILVRESEDGKWHIVANEVTT